MKKILFPLLSGGVDSTLATLLSIKAENSKTVSRIAPVFVDYGQNSRKQEWRAVINVSKRLRVEAEIQAMRFDPPVKIGLAMPDTDALGIFKWSSSVLVSDNESGKDEIENRNMVLISVVASYAKALTPLGQEAVIITGFRNEFYDTNLKFVEGLNKVFKTQNMHVKISVPVIDYKGVVGKKELIAKFSSMGYKDLIDLTWSCYKPKNGCPCGICSACKKRAKAFQ